MENSSQLATHKPYWARDILYSALLSLCSNISGTEQRVAERLRRGLEQTSPYPHGVTSPQTPLLTRGKGKPEGSQNDETIVVGQTLSIDI